MRTLLGVLFLLRTVSANAGTHDAWDAVLKTRSRGGFVDYAALKRDRSEFDRYLKILREFPAETERKLPRAERLAFWINAYNAAAVATVLDRYPIRKSWGLAAALYPANSIKQISGAFDGIEHAIAGRSLTLDAIENEILRGELGEPRIHFAIVCASIGCPPLRSEAYRPGSLDAQLEDNASAFLASGRVRVDPDRRTIYLSKIFKWFEKDFIRFAAAEYEGLPEAARGPLAFFGERLDAETRAALRGGNFSLSWLPYDWGLNDRRIE